MTPSTLASPSILSSPTRLSLLAIILMLVTTVMRLRPWSSSPRK